MNLTSLILLALKLSIFLTVLGIGLQASLQDATSLLRRPGLLLRSLVSMNVLMPLLAGVLVASFDLHPAVKIVLIALLVSPVLPILTKKDLRALGILSYTSGLLVVTVILSIVLIPITIEIFNKVFGTSARMSPGAVAALVFSTVLAPLTVGIFIHEASPSVA